MSNWLDLREGDCGEVMRTLQENSVDAIVSDPPYGLGVVKDFHGLLTDWMAGLDGSRHTGNSGFMQRAWDAGVPPPTIWREALRVLKPGGFAFVFASSRTYHYMAVSLELAGFIPHPAISWAGWIYAEGMPKGTNLGKQIDAQVGATKLSAADRVRLGIDITAPVSEQGKAWEGWYYGKQTLTPCYEPILVFQKPYAGTAVDSIQRWHTGAFNMDDSRTVGEIIEQNAAFGQATMQELDVAPDQFLPMPKRNASAGKEGAFNHSQLTAVSQKLGRLPANLVLSHMPGCKVIGYKHELAMAGSQSYFDHLPFVPGNDTKQVDVPGYTPKRYLQKINVWQCEDGCAVGEINRQTGGKAHFFPQCNPDLEDFWPIRYAIKPKDREKEAGLDDLPDQQVLRGNFADTQTEKNIHPTVKPKSLMQWLVRLVARPGAVILDPFLGSGTTLVAIAEMQEAGVDVNGIGIEREALYLPICRDRIAHVRSVNVVHNDGTTETKQTRPKLRQATFDIGA